MERVGILVDTTAMDSMSAEFGSAMRELEKRIHSAAGRAFNIASTRELARVLFEELKLPVLKRLKTGPSTDQDVLERLAEQHPLPALVLEHRSLAKLKGTYVDALPQLVEADGRIHTTFNQGGAATGRLSSSDPNLQNIPIRTEVSRRIRAAFVAPPGRRLLSADYSQIELRILAHLSGDEALIATFEQDEDIHRATAARLFGVSPDLVSHEMRNAAKRINFALLYGMAAFTLGKDLGVSTSEARSYIDSYFAQFPKVRGCLDAIVEEARRTREVTTLFGRVRPIPEIAASNSNVRGNAERMALNAPFQGSAADIIKIAMIRLDRELSRRGSGTKLLLQVHDELVLEAPDEEVPAIRKLVADVMEGAAQLRVRLAVHVGSAGDWLSAK
jgi:DNA polymerase-1